MHRSHERLTIFSFSKNINNSIHRFLKNTVSIKPSVLGKMPPGKMPPGNNPPQENCPPENCPPGKLPPTLLIKDEPLLINVLISMNI